MTFRFTFQITLKKYSITVNGIQTGRHGSDIHIIYKSFYSMLLSQGLESYWKRHSDCAEMLHDGVAKMGLQLYVKNKVSCECSGSVGQIHFLFEEHPDVSTSSNIVLRPNCVLTPTGGNQLCDIYKSLGPFRGQTEVIKGQIWINTHFCINTIIIHANIYNGIIRFCLTGMRMFRLLPDFRQFIDIFSVQRYSKVHISGFLLNIHSHDCCWVNWESFLFIHLIQGPSALKSIQFSNHSATAPLYGDL